MCGNKIWFDSGKYKMDNSCHEWEDSSIINLDKKSNYDE